MHLLSPLPPYSTPLALQLAAAVAAAAAAAAAAADSSHSALTHVPSPAQASESENVNVCSPNLPAGTAVAAAAAEHWGLLLHHFRCRRSQSSPVIQVEQGTRAGVRCTSCSH